MKERQAEEQRSREEELRRRQQEEMALRIRRQEEELHRRQQENTLFMQVRINIDFEIKKKNEFLLYYVFLRKLMELTYINLTFFFLKEQAMRGGGGGGGGGGGASAVKNFDGIPPERDVYPPVDGNNFSFIKQ